MAAATMPPEPPMPNLGSPRVRVAMRVLGILPKDLEKQDPSTYEGGQARFLLFERKRRNLIQQVQSMVASGEVHIPDSPNHRHASKNEFMDEVVRKEKLNSELMAKMAQKDIQKIVVQELEGKLVAHLGAEKQEESRQRLLRIHKERDEKLKQLRKLAEKKWDKSKEVRERATRLLEEEAKELTEKLHKDTERAESKFAKIASERLESRERNEERRSKIAVRQELFEQDLYRGRERQYHEIRAKHMASQSRLEEASSLRHSHTELRLERQQQSLERVRSFQEHKQAEAESRYWETLARHEKADKAREEKCEARVKELMAKHRKAKEAHRQRFERLLQELEQEEKSRQQLRSQSGSDPLRRVSSEPQLSPATSPTASPITSRHHLVDLVRDNRERVRRAHRYAVEQQIAKIATVREKVQALLDAKSEADRRRMDMLRTTSLEKSYLSEKVERFKDVGPSRVLRLLEDQELEPDAARRIGELLDKLGIKSSLLGREEEEPEKK